MQNIEELIRQFHIKHSFDVDKVLTDQHASPITELRVSVTLDMIATLLETLRMRVELMCEGMNESNDWDPRAMRVVLMIEELAEVVSGLIMKDEEKVLDGLADLIYVTIGTAVTFDLPIADAVLEVHRSNMTKNVRHDMRLRNKGSEYKEPNIRLLIRKRRYEKNSTKDKDGEV